MTKITFLGTGSSQGVPFIGCRCRVCNSEDRKDKRLRSSVLIEHKGLRIVIDAGPDFRYQMIRAGVRQIDALLLTHEHKDHIGGIDELRALNFVDYPIIRRINIYGTDHVLDIVRKDYDYAFVSNKFKGVPELDLIPISPPTPFTIQGVEIQPITGQHSERFTTTGYRIENFAYLTDFKKIEEEEIEKLRGIDTLIVNALRHEYTHSHFSLSEALELIAKVNPRVSYLTHMSHDMGLHAEIETQLPNGVKFAYDTLQIEI
ncbi:MAG: MBL fold metallo-hydrolase [Rikenellaceae bacterium]